MPSSTSSVTASGRAARTELNARLSLFLGLLAVLIVPPVTAAIFLGLSSMPEGVLLSFPILAGVLAVLLGHVARARIRKSMGEFKGKRMALTGLIFGYLGLIAMAASMALGSLVVPRGFVKAPAAIAHESDAQSVIRELNHAEASYASAFSQEDFAPDLATLGPGSAGTCHSGTAAHACLIDQVLGNADCTGTKWCSKDGYKYNIQPAVLPRQKAGYCISATPAKASSGAKSYCSLADGAIRYDLSRIPRTTPYTPRECGALPPL